MAKKLNPLLVEKYDISHKVLNELADLESRHILFSIIEKPKRVKDISKEQKIPMSSVYKKICDLKERSLITQKTGFLDAGNSAIFYQSLIKDVQINITKFELSISFTKNRKVKYE